MFHEMTVAALEGSVAALRLLQSMRRFFWQTRVVGPRI
jgi:hypothetical protein